MRSRLFWRRSVAAAGTYSSAVLGFLGTVIALHVFSTHTFGLYALVLAQPTEEFADESAGATLREAREIAGALAGILTTDRRLTSDGRAVIVSAAHPIWVGDEVRGAVIVEETANAVLAERNRAFERLFTIVLAALRKRMAALLSVQYHLGPGGLAVLLEDDERFSLYLQRFLADHHVPYTLPLYDDSGKYLFASPEKVEVLARGLLRAVGRGRDNELFVLLADLLADLPLTVSVMRVSPGPVRIFLVPC